MNSIINKRMKDVPVVFVTQGMAVIVFEMDNPIDRATYIKWLKTLVPQDPCDQISIDQCILSAGGEVDHGFPGYEAFQQ